MELPTSDPAQEALALKKALEWELSLDSRDLRSHAWYHGPIPRIRAEEIVQNDGDFLIRDCTSQPGNYVLTCKTRGPVLHFVINKVFLQRDTVYERVQYQFEDDAYDTVADLITFYVGSGKPISAASGAKIQYPCNRLHPLSFYINKYGIPTGGIHSVSALNSPLGPGFRYTPYNQQQQQQLGQNSYRSPMSSPPRSKKEIPPRLPSKKQRSQSLTPIQPSLIIHRFAQEKYCSADGVITGNGVKMLNSVPSRSIGGGHQEPRRHLSTEKCNSADGIIQIQNSSQSGANAMVRSVDDKFIQSDSGSHTICRSTAIESIGLSHKIKTHSLPRGVFSSSLSTEGYSQTINSKNDEAKEEYIENDCLSPPPKPIRAFSVLKHEYIKDFPLDQQGPLHRVASYHASGSDSGNGSGDSAHSSAAGDSIDVSLHRGGVFIRNPRFLPNSSSSVTLKSFVEFDPIAAEEVLFSMDIPVYEQISKFDLENFQTLLLPTTENKPLENGALNTFRMMLCETGPRIIANHLTRIDIQLILGDLDDKKKDNPLDCCGIELITLHHGKQFRLDLIERTECLKLLVAVTILTCPTDQERAETLNKWIEVAIDTKTALGNLFGFCCIMLGLCMPQIQKLETTWHILRQKFTDSAFTFEAKLRPTLKNMNDSSNPQAPNTTVPHLLPYILLKDRKIENILGSDQDHSILMDTCILPWESSASDFGLTILSNHLDAARNFAKNLSLYKRNAQTIMTDSSTRLDEILEDAFRTEFQMKFLWGSKGAMALSRDRHTKMEQILTLMAEKFCNEQQNNGTLNISN